MAICQLVLPAVGHGGLLLPVSGAGANIPAGTPVMPGATGGTNKGVAIPITATSNAKMFGLLGEQHNFSASGDATTATLVSWFPNGILATGNTKFPSHPVILGAPFCAAHIEYSLASTLAVASYSAGTITITSYEANRDGSFVYVNAGTGIGQIGFVASSSSGSCVLTSALTVALDSTSKLTQILPIGYTTPIWLVNTATAATQFDSSAAAGTGAAMILGNFIQKPDGVAQYLDPKVYHNAQALNALSSLTLWSYVAFRDTAFYV